MSADELVPSLYRQLQGLARSRLRGERAGHTLDTSALVHESYIRLQQQARGAFKSHSQFLSLASLVMRRVLVDHARERAAAKRGSGKRNLTLDDQFHGVPAEAEELLAVDKLLERLFELSDREGRVVVYRLYGGMTFEQIAEVLKVSVVTARRDWRMARAWLAKELSERP